MKRRVLGNGLRISAGMEESDDACFNSRQVSTTQFSTIRRSKTFSFFFFFFFCLFVCLFMPNVVLSQATYS